MSSMSPIWSTACPDWEKKILAQESLIPFEPLFHDEAEMALNVFKKLTLVDVAGKPKIRDVTAKWVFDFVGAIFGAYDYENNERLINEFFLLISKKNTKSTIAAGIMLTAIILNDRHSAEFLIIAPTKEVADNSFKPIRDMIRADAKLNALFSVSEHTRTVTHRVTKAELAVVAADTGAVGGKKGAYILVDELWIFGKRANAEAMLEEATGGMASFTEGFLIWLSTQSDEPPAGIFKKKLDYFRKVRDGEIDNPSCFPLIYEFPQSMIDDESYLDPDNFYVTNPNIGRSTHIKFLLNKFEQKKEQGPESVQIFLAKYLNVEIGLNKRADRWAGADFWQLCSNKHLTIEQLLELSDVVVVGLDGGGLDDLFGMAVMGRDKTNRGKWYLWNRAWAHEIVLERRKEIAPALLDFQTDLDLVIVKSLGEGLSQAGKIIKRLDASGKLPKTQSIGMDKLGMPSMQDGLIAEGVDFEKMVAVPQGYLLSGYAQTLEWKLAEGELIHAGQRLMNWCVGNAKGVMKGNALMITKQESGRGKIDPLMATMNAGALMSQNPEPPKKSYGVFFV